MGQGRAVEWGLVVDEILMCYSMLLLKIEDMFSLYLIFLHEDC